MVFDKSTAHLPLEKKLYQLIIGRLDGDRISVPQYKESAFLHVRDGIGGFILFGGKSDEMRHFAAELQAVAEYPLLIASDVERGVGQQVEGGTIFSCQMAVAAATDRSKPEDVALLDRALQAVARECAFIGINMPLIPVLDVNQNPENPIISTRAFSDDPEVVTWFGVRYIETLEKAGLVSCAKHFPGHGDTTVDSHLSLPVIGKALDELITTDIMPFVAAVRHGVSSIMVGHLSVPAIDSLPATLSPKIHELLRGTLGFDGLIVTDALTMKALDDVPDAAVRCLNAGADILVHPADPGETVEGLLSAVVSGRLSEGRVDEAVNRILKRKETLWHTLRDEIDFRTHAALSSQIADRSVCLIKGTPDAGPVAKAEDITVFVAGEGDAADVSLFRSLSPRVSKLPEQHTIRDLRNATTVIMIFTSIAAWKGHPGLGGDEQSRIRGIISGSRKSVVISFGNPYVLRHFPESDVLLAAFDASAQTQRAVARWLSGQGALYGKMPVTLS